MRPAYSEILNLDLLINNLTMEGLFIREKEKEEDVYRNEWTDIV